MQRPSFLVEERRQVLSPFSKRRTRGRKVNSYVLQCALVSSIVVTVLALVMIAFTNNLTESCDKTPKFFFPKDRSFKPRSLPPNYLDLLKPVVKVFIYDFPPALTPSTSDLMHVADKELHNALLSCINSPIELFDGKVTLKVTENPKKADLFFIPVYWKSVQKSSMLSWGEFTKDLVRFAQDHVLSKVLQTRQWRKCDGCNHAVVFSSGVGPAVLSNVKGVKNLLQRCIRFSVDGGLEGRSTGYPESVVAIPYPVQARIIKRYPCENSYKIPLSQRKHLLYFRGGLGLIERKGTQLRKGFRALLIEELASTPEQYPGEILVAMEKVSTATYYRELFESRFCLIPRGYTPATRHFEEAVVTGCIPVIVSDPLRPKFKLFLDYSSFSYFVAENNTQSIMPMLRNVDEETIRQKQLALSRVCHRFQYHHPPRNGDALHLALQEWILRSYMLGNDALFTQQHNSLVL